MSIVPKAMRTQSKVPAERRASPSPVLVVTEVSTETDGSARVVEVVVEGFVVIDPEKLLGVGSVAVVAGVLLLLSVAGVLLVVARVELVVSVELLVAVGVVILHKANTKVRVTAVMCTRNYPPSRRPSGNLLR
jgi:hypothetical protein